MYIAIAKTISAALIISFVSWLSGRKVGLAGFLTALPLTTLIALAFSHMQWKDPSQSVEYAKSIFYAVPISLLFFIPFLFAQKLQLSFWNCYFAGIFLLIIGYFLHLAILKL